MTGLDTNILVQLAYGDHQSHAATSAILGAEVAAGNRLLVPDTIITEFLHVVTDPKRFSPPLTMDQAVEWIAEFLERSDVSLIHGSPRATTQALAWVRQHGLGRKRLLDTQIAAMLIDNGAHRLVTSNPSDFTVFNIFELISP